MEFYDSHCHLTDERFRDKLEEEFSLLREAGIRRMICIGYDVESSKQCIELAEHYPEVYVAVGVHPENISGLDLSSALTEIKALAAHPKAIAIGEIGLDYHWYKEPAERALQEPWFIQQIDLANELGLPVSIHARDAQERTYQLLKEHPIHAGAVLHCYSGSVEFLREFAKLGLYFGFDGPITYKNAVTPKECVKECPIDRILVETDSPYMAPVPMRGKDNTPRYIPHIVAIMAELKGLSLEEMNRHLWENFEKLFRVKP